MGKSNRKDWANRSVSFVPQIVQPENLHSTSDIDDFVVFSFQNMAKSYAIEDCQDKKEKAFAVDKMREISRKTWNELILRRKQDGGFERIERKKFDLKSIPDGIPADITAWYIIRFHGNNGRLIGYRVQNTFYITHLDHSCTAYSH